MSLMRTERCANAGVTGHAAGSVTELGLDRLGWLALWHSRAGKSRRRPRLVGEGLRPTFGDSPRLWNERAYDRRKQRLELSAPTGTLFEAVR